MWRHRGFFGASPSSRLLHGVMFGNRSFDVRKTESRNCGPSHYQLDFLTPGIIPSFAYSRKQMRQSQKSRINARFLPHRKQRRTMRVENFGFFNARALVEVFAMADF